MTLATSVLIVFMIALIVLFLAMTVYRHQRRLEQKKVEYLALKKETATHWMHYEKAQVNIDRIKSKNKEKQNEMGLMQMEINRNRKEISEIMEILKEEIKNADEEMNQDLSRIISRRKAMLKKSWSNCNLKKRKYLDDLNMIRTLNGSQLDENRKKDVLYNRWKSSGEAMEKIKRDYESLANSSALPFLGRKKS